MPVIETKGAASSGAYGQFARQVAANYIEDVFSTYLYTGTGAGFTGNEQNIINGIDLSGKGGLAWIKARTSTSGFNSFYNRHQLYDTARGFTNLISSNTTDANADTSTAVTTRSDGFRLASGGSYYGANFLNVTYASWTFRKQAKFFDIVTYTGDGSGSRLINHSLGSAPGLVIIKNTTTPSNWPVMFAPTSGNAYGFSNAYSGGGLNTDAAGYSLGSVSGVSTATQFRVGFSYWGAGSETNDSGSTYIAYVFANNAGGFGASGTENAITCGTYTGNGSTTGPIITLGYEPQFLLIKNREAGTYENWVMVDTMRGLPVNGPAALLFANVGNSEASNNPFINVSATGFQPVVSSSRINASGNNYMYMAIRRGPMRTPTSGTSVFAPISRTGTGSSTFVSTSGFPSDNYFVKRTDGSGSSAPGFYFDRLRGGSSGGYGMSPTSTAAENSLYQVLGFDAPNNNGVRVGNVNNYYNASGDPYVDYHFRRAPGFFDVVCYTGTSSIQTVNHNLGVEPELWISKVRNQSDYPWYVYAKPVGIGNFGYLGGVFGNVAFGASGGLTSVSSSNFVLPGGGFNTNYSGFTYVTYLFASCPGVSKVGSYTGTGAAQTINCGFTGGARFVLIKRTDSTGDWYVWDTARGIVAGNDPYLLLNSTAAEVTGTDYIDPLSTGFEISSTAPAAINANGGSFIFLAIA